MALKCKEFWQPSWLTCLGPLWVGNRLLHCTNRTSAYWKGWSLTTDLRKLSDVLLCGMTPFAHLRIPPSGQWHSLKKNTHSLKETEPFFEKAVWLTEFWSLHDSCCRLGIGCMPFSNGFHRNPRVLPAGACFLPTEADGADHAVQRIVSEPCLPQEQLFQMPRHRHQRIFNVHLKARRIRLWFSVGVQSLLGVVGQDSVQRQ